MADIRFTGNLGGDVELRYTASGKAVASFTVADGLRRKNQQTGEWEDVGTTWWRVTVWDRLAEALTETLRKGTRVIVDGTVHSREWEAKDGTKRLSYDVTAKTVGVIPKMAGGSSAPASGGDPWATAPAGNDEPPF